jgi:prepilin-type N-terminal cleavage/methylation domain-containing protein
MRKGFTLIELLIVVAIIAILAAIAVPNFLEAQVRAKVSRVKADMRSLATALESYTVDNNKPLTVIILNNTAANEISGPSLIQPGKTSCVSARFMRLTTPIAYFTSVVPDPFAKDGFGLDINNAPTTQYDTFDYFNAFDFAPGGVKESTGSWRGAGLTSGAAWRLSSAGPDKINRFGGGPVSSGAPNIFGVDYDPTNGTISRGDVVRIGGGPGPINGVAANLQPSVDRINNRYNQAGM